MTDEPERRSPRRGRPRGPTGTGEPVMRVVDAPLGEQALRSRSIRLAHAETGLSAGLEPGEVVLLRADDEWWTACVVDIAFDRTETHYDLALGGRVPPEQAVALATPTPGARDARSVEVSDVVLMLGSLADRPGVPGQRRRDAPAGDAHAR